MAYRVQLRRGTASQWSTENPILLEGEFAIETDTKKFKIGDGITTWNNLPYATQGEAGKSLQYVWDGTRLGIKREGETSYTYVDLKGDEGKPGTTTWEGITDKPTEFMPIPHEHDILYYKKETVDTKLNAKVDKVANKGLSTNDYTDTEKAKNQKNADNISNLQNVRIYEGTTQPTDTRFWYDPTEMGRFKIIEDGTPRKMAWKDEVDSLAGEGRTTETVKDNADKIGVLTEKVNPVAPLNTTSQDLSGAVNEIKGEIDINKQELDQNKQETQLKVLNVEKELNDYKRTLQQVNVNHEAKQSASGYGTISLPKNAANGQVSVSVKGLTYKNLNDDNFTPMQSNLSIENIENTLWEKTFTAKAKVDGAWYGVTAYVDEYIGKNLFISLYVGGVTNKEGGAQIIFGGISNIRSIDIISDDMLRFGITISKSNFKDSGNLLQIINCYYTETLAGDSFSFGGLMINEITDEEYNNLSVEELMQKYPYINGTKSTISASRLKSVGKNLFNPNKFIEQGFVRNSEGYYIENNSNSYGKIIWENKEGYKGQIVVEIEAKSAPSLGSVPAIYYTDGTSKSIKYIPNTDFNIERFISQTDKVVKSIAWTYGFGSSPTTIKRLFVSKDIKSEYEPYIESTAYVVAKKDNKIVNLRSLPNGAKDEINVTDRKLIKRIGEKSNIANGMVIDFADMAEGGTYYAWNEDGETETGIKGDTLGIDATTLIYQLAEPEIIPIEVSGSLVSYPNGTVYFEKAQPDANVYNNGISIQEQELNIDYIDKLSKVDYETGIETELDASKAVIAEDKKSFTHPDLMNGDMVFFEYFYSNESTQGEATVEYYDSRYVIPDKTLPDKYYKWDIEVDNGVPNVTVTEV